MSASRMLASLIGSLGGSTLGGMVGGRTGRMIGAAAGGMLARQVSGGGLAALGGLLRGGNQSAAPDRSGQGDDQSGALGGLLGSVAGGDASEFEEAARQLDEDEARLLIRAMCSAAKSDGHIDPDELKRIVGKMGDLTEDDERFLRSELSSPVDIEGLVNDVPPQLKNEVYVASLLAVDLDSQAEQDYLARLATALGIDSSTRSEIHRAVA